MTEKKRKVRGLPEQTGPAIERLELGSLESRAAARRLAEGIGAYPNLITCFVWPNKKTAVDENGNEYEYMDQSEDTEFDSQYATSPVGNFFRQDGETLAQFKERVRDALPVNRPAGGNTVFWLNEEDAYRRD